MIALISGLAAGGHERLHEEFVANMSEALKHRKAVSVPTPETYDEAMRSDFAVDWKEAVKAEIDNLDKYKVHR
jgi:hypothetical protein